ncbi:hypothetical protein [Roseobacter litoralis]|uniref:hypothetical protein n=1 Tax=Roseobacter litoralis TaxID=42443 RepID=UPI0024930BF8|nr:hypothetical protein [Roseobacter litoralis]
MAHIIDKDGLPDHFPTHRHTAKFWEQLGRVVATFGFLEEVLGKAIFACTATRPYREDEIEAAYKAWLPKLERALYDPLGKLITSFVDALRKHPNTTTQNIDELEETLRAASKMRNVLCHGSWRSPDKNGAAIPLFVRKERDKDVEVFDTAIDAAFLLQTQMHVAELACEIVNTVTHMGWRFPGSVGPGEPIS